MHFAELLNWQSVIPTRYHFYDMLSDGAPLSCDGILEHISW